jgi:hypothetical protein
LDDEDSATVITMQMQATRIDLLQAPSGLNKKRKNVPLLMGGALWILDEGEKEKQ